MKKLFWWIIGIILFLLGIGFALLNHQIVTFNYGLGKIQLPLALMLVVFFVIGGVIGMGIGYVKGRVGKKGVEK